MWENNDYTLHFNRNPFYRHEQIILAAGTCDGYLPMSYLRGSDGLTARYEAGGYLPLSGFRIERTQDVLYLMERTVRIPHISPEHLLAPERVTLRTDTVFYCRERDDLRIAFLPVPETESSISNSTDERTHASASRPGRSIVPPFQRRLVQYLAQLKQDLKDPHMSYLLRLAKDLCYNRPDTADILRTIGLLRRELDALPKTPPK